MQYASYNTINLQKPLLCYTIYLTAQPLAALGTLSNPGHSSAQQRQPWLPTFAKLYLLCTGLPLGKTHQTNGIFMLCVAGCEWWGQMSGTICVQLR